MKLSQFHQIHDINRKYVGGCPDLRRKKNRNNKSKRRRRKQGKWLWMLLVDWFGEWFEFIFRGKPSSRPTDRPTGFAEIFFFRQKYFPENSSYGSHPHQSNHAHGFHIKNKCLLFTCVVPFFGWFSINFELVACCIKICIKHIFVSTWHVPCFLNVCAKIVIIKPNELI